MANMEWKDYPPNEAIEYGVLRDNDKIVLLLRAKDQSKADAMQDDLTLAEGYVKQAVQEAMEGDPDFGYRHTTQANNMVPKGRGIKFLAQESLDKLAAPGSTAPSFDPQVSARIHALVDGAIASIVAPATAVQADPALDQSAQGKKFP